MSTFQKILYFGSVPTTDETNCKAIPLIEGCEDQKYSLNLSCFNPIYDITYEDTCPLTFYKRFRYTYHGIKVPTTQNIVEFIESQNKTAIERGFQLLEDEAKLERTKSYGCKINFGFGGNPPLRGRSRCITFENYIEFYNENKDKILMETKETYPINKQNMKRWVDEVSSAKRENCDVLETRAKTNRDFDAAKKYLANKGCDTRDNTETYKLFAKIFKNVIRHISFGEMLEKIHKICNEILVLVKQGNYADIYMYVAGVSSKSNTWISLLFTHFLANNTILKDKGKVINDINLVYNLYQKDPSKKILVLHMDDMSYSGTQMESAFKMPYGGFFTKENEENDNLHYYLGVAFIGSSAIERFKNRGHQNIKYFENTEVIKNFTDQAKDYILEKGYSTKYIAEIEAICKDFFFGVSENGGKMSRQSRVAQSPYSSSLGGGQTSDEEKMGLDVFCVPVEQKSNKWVLPTTWLGKRGGFGSIAQVCKKINGKCDYVMKVISLKQKRKNPKGFALDDPPRELGTGQQSTKEEFLNEVELQKGAAKENLAPPVSDYWVCEDPSVGVIIMPMLDRTLLDVWTDKSVPFNQKKIYKAEADSLLRNLNKLKIHHGDSHGANFMFDKQDKLKLIDFGFSRTIEPCYFHPEKTIATWIIPSANALSFSFADFFKDMRKIQDKVPTRSRRGRVPFLSERVRQTIDKHRQDYNDRFRGERPPIATREQYIQDLCGRYYEDFYDSDRSMLDDEFEEV